MGKFIKYGEIIIKKENIINKNDFKRQLIFFLQ